jgi:hypothetical protein
VTEFEERKFKEGGFVSRPRTEPRFELIKFNDSERLPVVRQAVDRQSGFPDKGELTMMQREQIMRMDAWLRTADRVRDFNAVGGSEGTDGVVVSVDALEKESDKWLQQQHMISGSRVVWRSLTRRLGAIARRLSLPRG